MAKIGIVKGKPFQPDARMKKILTDAAAIGSAAGRTLNWNSRPSEGWYYYGSRDCSVERNRCVLVSLNVFWQRRLRICEGPAVQLEVVKILQNRQGDGWTAGKTDLSLVPKEVGLLTTEPRVARLFEINVVRRGPVNAAALRF